MKLVPYDLWLGSLGRLLVGWHPRQASIAIWYALRAGAGRLWREGALCDYIGLRMYTESFTSFTFQRKSSIAESKVSKISFQTGNFPWRCVIIVKVKKSHLGAEGCSLSCDNR